MMKTLEPAKDILDLSGKVVVVTGGETDTASR